jgi:hypothetical protein
VVRRDEMAAFRKKPVVVQAVQYHADALLPSELSFAVRNGLIVAANNMLTIRTLEGDMIAADGDWIICGVKGELYPCKPDIFEATYERAEP